VKRLKNTGNEPKNKIKEPGYVKRGDRNMEKTWKPTVGGILAIIAGVFQVIIVTLSAIGWGLMGGLVGMGWASVTLAPLIVFGIIAIVGGTYALRRRVWGLALAGSICALFNFVGILGILAIIFVSLGKGKFE
jgi:hypothetical protein